MWFLENPPTNKAWMQVWTAMAQGCGIILFGFFSCIFPFPYDLIHLFLSFYCMYFVMITLSRTITLAISDSLPGENSRNALRAAHNLATFSWVGVPVVWTAAYCGALSHATEEALYQVAPQHRDSGTPP